MSRFNAIREALIQEMCEVGEIIRRGDDLFEDMGGHMVHESQLDDYITNWMQGLTDDEREEVISRTGGPTQ